MCEKAERLIQRYYTEFNAGDMPALLALLTEDVIHDIIQGVREIRRDAFTLFLARMNRSYDEQLVDLEIMLSRDGRRAAAEFTVVGQYLISDEGLPLASGQRYRLPAGAFFELRENHISRVTNYYNLWDWVFQVGG